MTQKIRNVINLLNININMKTFGTVVYVRIWFRYLCSQKQTSEFLCLLYCIAALYNLQLIMVFSERKYLEELRDIYEDNVILVMKEGVNLKELS